MIDPMQALLQPNIPPTNLFDASSRYSGIETATIDVAEGKVIIYLRRRFAPSAERFETLQEHVVTQNERLDNIAAQYVGDPLLFWRICDANNAMRPDALTESIGRRLRITLPEGIVAPTS
jgi:hypothetical protein